MNIANLLAIGSATLVGIIVAAVVVVCAVVAVGIAVPLRKKSGKNSAVNKPAANGQDAQTAVQTENNADDIGSMAEELSKAQTELDKLHGEIEEVIDTLSEPAAPSEEEAALTEEAVEEPAVIEEPVAEETVVEETVAEETEVVEEPVVEETVVEETVAEVTEAVEEPVVVEEPVAEEPVAEIPKAEKPKKEKKPAAVRKEPKVAPEGKVFVRIRYNRSYTAKIIQSEDTLKNYYSVIKNELLSYGVKPRISWRHETFRKGRKLLARMAIRGKTLSVYFALDPADYADSKYKILDVSAVAKNAAVPTLYKIKNDRRLNYSKDLIAAVMAQNGLERKFELNDDYAAQYPYEELESLIEKSLIKLVTREERSTDYEIGEIAVPVEDIPEEIAAAIAESAEIAPEEEPEVEPEEVAEEITEVEPEIEEEPEVEPEPEIEEEPEVEPEPEIEEEPEVEPAVDMSISFEEAEEILDDKYVEAFVHQGNRYSDKTKKAIVNVDTLGKYFNKGERVTVNEIKKRVPGIGKNVTYIKVLGRGTLDKALTVEADDFSPAAIKMIVLTGGEVVRTKRT